MTFLLKNLIGMSMIFWELYKVLICINEREDKEEKMNMIQKIGLMIMSLFVMVMTLSAMPVDVKEGAVEKEKIHKLLELSDDQVKRIKKYRQNRTDGRAHV